MEAAMKQTRDKYEFRVRWLPYFLRPNTPPEGEPKTSTRNVDVYLKEEGESVGIDITDKCPVYPNTVKAHVLLQLAADNSELQSLILELLFKAHLTEGRVLDVATLTQIAESAGLKKADAETALASQERVARAYQEAVNSPLARDVRGVPCYYMNNQRVLQGAQQTSVYAQMFDMVAEIFPHIDTTEAGPSLPTPQTPGIRKSLP